MSPDDVVETFRCSAELSAKLDEISRRYDRSKSHIIRSALERHFRDLDFFEVEVWDAVTASIIKSNTKKRS